MEIEHMRVEDFVSVVAGEPEVAGTQTVWVTPSGVLEQARKSGMSLTAFLAAPGRRAEERDVRYRHILGPPASPQEIERWEAMKCKLSDALRALVATINGIHLWANVATGRSYMGIAPIDEWDLARIKLGGELEDRFVAISYHADGAAFVVVDVEADTYFLMDVSGPDTDTPIASSLGGLLDWIWESRMPPKGLRRPK